MNKGWRWPNKTEVVYPLSVYFLSKQTLDPFCFSLAKGIVSVAVDKASQPGEGGIVKLAPIINFLVVEKGIIVLGGCLNAVMLGGIGLDDDLPA